MPTDYDYHSMKNPKKIYVSQRFINKNPLTEEERRTRNISKVFDISELHFFEYLKEYKSIVLRKTPNQRQEVRLTVIEDEKNISGISIQRFNVISGLPTKESFYFLPGEFKIMLDLLKSIKFIDFSDPKHFQITDEQVKNNVSDIIELISGIPVGEIDPKIIRDIFQKITSDTKVTTIINSLSPDELNLLSTNHFEIQRRRILEELKQRLSSSPGFSETIGDDSWQKWISKNSWLTGANYIEPIEKQRISITGIMPDYLFPTHDGFVDILEIKLPTDDVIKIDPNHPGSWILTAESNKALGQVVNYLGEIDRLRREIEDEIKGVYFKDLSLIKPRAYILIGDDNRWFIEETDVAIRNDKRNRKLAALRKVNLSLHGIEIITYAELLRRGNSFISEINI